MNYTTREIDEIVKPKTNEIWQEVLDMVKEVAPEEAKIIEQHADICLRLFYQGVRRGWVAGADYLAQDLIERDKAAFEAGVRTLQ